MLQQIVKYQIGKGNFDSFARDVKLSFSDVKPGINC